MRWRWPPAPRWRQTARAPASCLGTACVWLFRGRAWSARERAYTHAEGAREEGGRGERAQGGRGRNESESLKFVASVSKVGLAFQPSSRSRVSSATPAHTRTPTATLPTHKMVGGLRPPPADAEAAAAADAARGVVFVLEGASLETAKVGNVSVGGEGQEGEAAGRARGEH